MNWLKELVPMLGTVLGGPAGALVSAFGGVAASFVAEKLGLEDSTVETVNKALTAGRMTPEQIVKLKEAELEFQKFLETNKIDLEKVAAADRDSARKMQIETKSIIPGVLAIVIVGGFFAILTAMMLGKLTVDDQQSLLILLGALSAGFGSVLNFYFGSSHGSQAKSEMLARKP